MKIAKLKWTQPCENNWTANTPASHLGYVTIWFEEGRYWPCYEMAPAEGTDTLEESLKLCQKFHDEYIITWLEEEYENRN